MTEYFTQNEVVAAVPGLSNGRLAAFLRAGLLQPLQSPSGPLFRPVDLARLELLCDLADHFDLKGDGLGVVIGLIDQLHDTRHRLNAMAQAMQAEPHEMRARVGARLIGILTV